VELNQFQVIEMRKHYGKGQIDKFLTPSYLSPTGGSTCGLLGVAFCLSAAQIVLHNLTDSDGGQGFTLAILKKLPQDKESLHVRRRCA
jgi:hypothetical protein